MCTAVCCLHIILNHVLTILQGNKGHTLWIQDLAAWVKHQYIDVY